MVSFSRALAAGALFANVALATDNFIITQTRPLMYSRVDPLVNPGANGDHVHNVISGSAFSPYTTSAESLQSSQCSTNMVQDDKSAYWAPLVYYKHANGSFSAMPSTARIYYFEKPGNGTTPVVAFPKGFRMLGGAPSNKHTTSPPRGQLSYDQLQAMDPRVAAIKWGCSAGAVQGQGSGGSMDGQRPYLPNDAPSGCGVINAGMFYPSCSDGRLDSDDHFSHMAYPLDGSNGYNCPPSHPIKYPTMFFEIFYFPRADQPYRGPNQCNWVLSSGDCVGTSYHADFINGWKDGVLENVMKDCNTPNAVGDDLSKCPHLAQSLNVDAANNCRSQGDIVAEDVGLQKAIPKLPGCNVWPDDQETHPGCKDAQVQMGQPAGRYVLDEFKMAVPIAAEEGTGQAKTGGSSSSSSSSSASTSTTSSATSTTSQPATTTTTSAATTSSASTTSSEAPAVKNESSSSAAPTTTSSYADDYNYGAAPPAGSASASTSTSSSAASTTTASSDDYNYGAPPAAGTSSSSSSSSAAPTTTASNDDYNYGAPAAAGTSISSSSSSSAVPTTSDYNFGAPAPAPVANSNPTTTTGAATSSVTPSGSATKSINPSGTPTPQQANAGGPHKPQKTCRPKRKGKGHHRRGWQSRLIN